MNKATRFIVMLAVLTGGAVANAQNQKEEERERMAKAKVKTQIEFTHDYKDGKPVEEGYKSAERSYDTHGNLTQEINYNAAGKVLSLVMYQYDNHNRQVNYERYQGNKEKLQYSQKIVYNPTGKKTREYGFDGTSQYSNNFIYDNAGQLVEIEYTTNNKPVENRVLKTDGKVTTIRIFDENGKELFKQVNTYNAKGNLISELKSDNAGREIYSFTNTYKNDVLLTSMTKKRNGTILEFQKFYTYDNKDRLIKEETINMNGAKFVSHEYQFNTADFLEREAWKKSQQSKEFSTNRLDYDSKGIYSEKESYFATYKLYSLYKYKYEFYQ